MEPVRAVCEKNDVWKLQNGGHTLLKSGVARWREGSKRRGRGRGRVISRVVKIHSREKQPGSYRRHTIYRFIGGSFPCLSPVFPPRGWHVCTEIASPPSSPRFFHFILSQSVPSPCFSFRSISLCPLQSLLVAVSSDSFLDMPRPLSTSSSPSGPFESVFPKGSMLLLLFFSPLPSSPRYSCSTRSIRSVSFQLFPLGFF